MPINPKKNSTKNLSTTKNPHNNTNHDQLSPRSVDLNSENFESGYRTTTITDESDVEIIECRSTNRQDQKFNYVNDKFTNFKKSPKNSPRNSSKNSPFKSLKGEFGWSVESQKRNFSNAYESKNFTESTLDECCPENLTTLGNTKSKSFWIDEKTVFVESEMIVDIGCEVRPFSLPRTKNKLLNLVKLNQIWIEITLFRLHSNQTEIRL